MFEKKQIVEDIKEIKKEIFDRIDDKVKGFNFLGMYSDGLTLLGRVEKLEKMIKATLDNFGLEYVKITEENGHPIEKNIVRKKTAKKRKLVK